MDQHPLGRNMARLSVPLLQHPVLKTYMTVKLKPEVSVMPFADHDRMTKHLAQEIDILKSDIEDVKTIRAFGHKYRHILDRPFREWAYDTCHRVVAPRLKRPTPFFHEVMSIGGRQYRPGSTARQVLRTWIANENRRIQSGVRGALIFIGKYSTRQLSELPFVLSIEEIPRALKITIGLVFETNRVVGMNNIKLPVRITIPPAALACLGSMDIVAKHIAYCIGIDRSEIFTMGDGCFGTSLTKVQVLEAATLSCIYEIDRY